MPPLTCVIGMGTDVGKTVATAALLRAAIRLGFRPRAPLASLVLQS